MHHEAAIIAIKPLVLAVGIAGLFVTNRLFAQTEIGQTFEAISMYGLPTVLVVYFVIRDWYKEQQHATQAIKDKEQLAQQTEADKQRSHEARQTREREYANMIAAERSRNHELQMIQHEIQLAILEIMQHGTTDLRKLTDSTTGKFIKQQHSGKSGNSQ